MTTKAPPMMISNSCITVNIEGKSYSVSAKSNPFVFDEVKVAIREERWHDLASLMDPRVAVAASGAAMGNDVVFNGDTVLVDGEEVPGELAAHMVEFAKEKLSYSPLVNFCRKLRKNPSFRAVNSLYGFLEKNRHPITEDGNFIAYKKVRRHANGKLMDIHSGTMDNSVGNVLEMPRNKVNEDPEQTCSYGLHVAAWSYAHDHYGCSTDVLLSVEVDPADVVAIPTDYNSSKIRCCRYKVICEVSVPNPSKTLYREEPKEEFVPETETSTDFTSEYSTEEELEDIKKNVRKMSTARLEKYIRDLDAAGYPKTKEPYVFASGLLKLRQDKLTKNDTTSSYDTTPDDYDDVELSDDCDSFYDPNDEF